MSSSLSKAADSLSYAKKMLAHAYITSTVDVSSITTAFKEIPFDSFVYKASAKAFKETINTEKLSITRVHSVE